MGSFLLQKKYTYISEGYPERNGEMMKEIEKGNKKSFFRRKRKTGIQMRSHKAGFKKAIPILAVFSLLFVKTMPVYGTEKPERAKESNIDKEESVLSQAPKEIITYIYHRHIGNRDVFGGCYKLAIEHEHDGNASTGGGCYTKPVLHSHQGSEDTGGGCYGKEIYHEHQGNTTEGGGCFSEPVKHEHQNSCYEERACTISYTTVNVISTETGRCFSGHGESAFVRAEGIAVHDSCDTGTENTIIRYCQQCGFMAPMIHDYQAVLCGKDEDTVENYKIGCGKEDTDVERYEPDCGYKKDEIEFYEPDCGIDVDGYALDCGLKEDVPCGRFIVTNETQGIAEQVTLCVKLEDLTGGKLELDSKPYVWWDESGNQVGSGDKIQVKENGDYSVRVRLKNKDVDESGLVSKIPVDNIYKASGVPTPSAMPSQSPAISEKPASSSSPAPADTPDEKPDAASSEDGENSLEENNENVLKDLKDEITERKEDEDAPAASAQIQESAKRKVKKAAEKKALDKPSPSMPPSPKIIKETKKAVIPKKQALEEIRYKVGQSERKNNIFANPMVRMITVTAGVLALIAGILLWLFYLANSVKIYNDNGEGGMIYLGRCIVRLEEDTYAIKITETMVEKAYTNRYCIKPGLFRLGREDEALVVYKGSQNTTVYIKGEMIAVLH